MPSTLEHPRPYPPSAGRTGTRRADRPVRAARIGARIIDATTTRNFAFLAAHDPALADVAALAERYFADNPVTSLMKVRQLGELLAQLVAARAGVLGDAEEPHAELLGRLRREPGSRAT